MRKGNFFWPFSRLWCSHHALLPAVMILGMMLLLLPASAQQSNSSGEHSMIWTQLSERFERTLDQHEKTLSELSEKLRTSEANGQKLTDLSGELSRQNEDLRNYNQQIGERMQERDEDLAAACDKIDRLEKTVLKAVIVIIVMGALVIGAVAFKILRLMKIIPI